VFLGDGAISPNPPVWETMVSVFVGQLTQNLSGLDDRISSKAAIVIAFECTDIYEGWNFNSGNYLFTTDTK